MWVGWIPGEGVGNPGGRAGHWIGNRPSSDDRRGHGGLRPIRRPSVTRFAALGTSLAVAVMVLASCNSSNGSLAQSDVTDAPTTKSTIAAALDSGATIEASSTGGDSITTTVDFGPGEPVANSNVDLSILENCGFDPSRALIIA